MRLKIEIASLSDTGKMRNNNEYNALVDHILGLAIVEIGRAHV